VFHSLDVLGQLYVAVFGISGVICFVGLRRARAVGDPDVRRGLVWLLATAGAWALLKSLFFVVPDPFPEIAYLLGLAIGFATVWAWLYFCSAYTGQNYHHDRTLRRLGILVFLAVVSVKVTNPLHGAYFTTTDVSTPFTYVAIEHNVLHWTATGLSYVLSAIGLFMIFQLYWESEYDTGPLIGLTLLMGLPVVFDIGAQFTDQLVDTIYAPIGVAAFSLGVLFVYERRFIAVQQTGYGDTISIYLDEGGRIRDYSLRAGEILPELENSTGERLSDVVPDVEEVVDTDTQIIEREHADDLRYYFITSSTVSLGDSGVEVIQLTDVTRTERQRRELARREQELDEQNELYRAVIDASFAFVFRLDLSGQFTFVSPSVEEFLGYSPDELRGQQISMTHPDEETTERAWDQIEPVVKGEPNVVRDFPLETKDGMTVYTDIRGVPIYEGGVQPDDRTPEEIVGIQLMVRDATERRQREGLISVINRVLRHNLRNRMTIITSYAEMLATKLDGDDAEKATHIKDTADRLLDLSESAQRIEENRDASPELEPIDIVPILDRTISQVRMQHSAASVTVKSPDTALVRSHERLETALWEILDNAAAHGGTPPSVEIDVSVTESQCEIAVRDNGPGLPEIEQEILESTTETQLAHGEGLGLWLVYWIVTSLEGDIEATVSPHGTTITIQLPRPA
jgi:PAS domain S-box-containing protein